MGSRCQLRLLPAVVDNAALAIAPVKQFAVAVRPRFAESNIMAVSSSSPLGRRIRLGVIGGAATR